MRSSGSAEKEGGVTVWCAKAHLSHLSHGGFPGFKSALRASESLGCSLFASVGYDSLSLDGRTDGWTDG